MLQKNITLNSCMSDWVSISFPPAFLFSPSPSRSVRFQHPLYPCWYLLTSHMDVPWATLVYTPLFSCSRWDTGVRSGCQRDMLGWLFWGREIFSVSLSSRGNRGKREQMLAAAALNKNTSLLSFRIKSVEKEDLQALWSEQTAAIERYNCKNETSHSCASFSERNQIYTGKWRV